MDTAKKIFAYGAGFNPPFIGYVGMLTGKSNPKLCYLPTASADNPYLINAWFEQCVAAKVTPYVQPMFISSYRQDKGFEEVLLNMDGIVVGGGNTVNMLAIWQAHGIDKILRQAWEQGIVLAGGSAGSLCWFEQGTTDSRPKAVSEVSCLGFLSGSHCPHYDSEPTRRPLYHKLIKEGRFKSGYACDDRAGIYFEDQTVKRVVTLNDTSNAYYVYCEDGEVKEQILEKEVLT